MFWTDEDIQPAVDLAVKLFGPSNKYDHDNKNAYRNVRVHTRQYGTLWFGDLELNENTKENLEKLSATINQEIYFSGPHVSPYDFENANYTTISKLREMSSEMDNYK